MNPENDDTHIKKNNDNWDMSRQNTSMRFEEFNSAQCSDMMMLSFRLL
jgi:hypothetical protein